MSISLHHTIIRSVRARLERSRRPRRWRINISATDNLKQPLQSIISVSCNNKKIITNNILSTINPHSPPDAPSALFWSLSPLLDCSLLARFCLQIGQVPCNSSHGRMQVSWYTCKHGSWWTTSFNKKSSQQTEHCSLASTCCWDISTLGIASITSLARGGGPNEKATINSTVQAMCRQNTDPWCPSDLKAVLQLRLILHVPMHNQLDCRGSPACYHQVPSSHQHPGSLWNHG